MGIPQQFKFGTKHLLRLPVAVCPLFLSLSYANYNSNAHALDPIRSLVWFLVVPMAYVFVMVVCRLQSHPITTIFPAIRSGVQYALLFSVLAWGPFGIPKLVVAVQEFWALAQSGPRRGLDLSFPTMMYYSAQESPG